MTLGRSLFLSDLWFPLLLNKKNNTYQSLGMLGKYTEMFVKVLS